MVEGESSKKRKLELNWDEINRQPDEMDLLPEVLSEKKGSHTDDQPRQQCTPSATIASEDDKHCSSSREEFAAMTDGQLEEAIVRQRRTLTTIGGRLPDGGGKIRAVIKSMEEERDRRKSARATMGVGDSKQFRQLVNTGVNGAPSGSKEMASSETHSQSRFGSLFRKKMEDNADHKAANAFDSELSALGPYSRPKVKLNEGFSQNGREKNGSSRKWGFQSSLGWKDRGISSDSFYCKGQSASKHFSNGVFGRKEESPVPPSCGLRPRKRATVVLLDDDDDDEVLESLDCADETRDECMKDAKIYYPSRDDPECIEICFQDIDCLGPENFLTSPIMNFYIRYLELQASLSQKSTCDYHIFNTFFYKKLKQELSRKGSEKESLFVKFRRWWKGVNLFEKAYVLIPIHQDLVIICFPEKKDNRSGPIVLHLDSLNLHYSRVVLENITSFLRAEWQYLHEEVAAQSDVEMSDRIRKRLRNIISKKIEVPQQKNDYDCGIFVLFFMERFIDEAPERLKEVDLDMFGKQWFKPEEASRLRKRIRDLLKTEFINSRKDSIACRSSVATSGDMRAAENGNSAEESLTLYSSDSG